MSPDVELPRYKQASAVMPRRFGLGRLAGATALTAATVAIGLVALQSRITTSHQMPSPAHTAPGVFASAPATSSTTAPTSPPAAPSSHAVQPTAASNANVQQQQQPSQPQSAPTTAPSTTTTTSSSMPLLPFGPAPASISCSRFYSGGSIATFVNGLAAGQVGCLHSGSYAEDVTITTPGVTLSSGPNERASLRGRVWVFANGVTVQYMNLDGSNVGSTSYPSPTVNAQATFRFDDITSSQSNNACFDLGTYGGKSSSATVIQYNRIHNCNASGIIIDAATQTEIDHNVIFGNAHGGIEMYSGATSSTITNNILDGNNWGITYSGTAAQYTATHNDITESQSSDVISWGVSGSGNSVDWSCITNSPGWSATGVTKGANNRWVSAPSFVNKGGGDFTSGSGDACAGTLQ